MPLRRQMPSLPWIPGAFESFFLELTLMGFHMPRQPFALVHSGWPLLSPVSRYTAAPRGFTTTFSRLLTWDWLVTVAFFATLSAKLFANAVPSRPAAAKPAAATGSRIVRCRLHSRISCPSHGSVIVRRTGLRLSFMWIASELGSARSTDRQGPLHAAIAVSRHAAKERVGPRLQLHGHRPGPALEGRSGPDCRAACALLDCQVVCDLRAVGELDRDCPGLCRK